MEGHRCGTCLHYDPSPSWRKGWCRNSILFSSRQSHLVQDDELDCSRGTGDFWEPKRGQADPRSEIAGHANVRYPKLSPLRLFAPVQPGFALADVGSDMMFATDSNDGGYGPSPGESGPRNPRGNSGGGGRQRTVQFQPEERYWTEYLRIALPIVGLLLMIGLFWFWATELINDPANSDQPGTTVTPPGASQLLPDDSTPEPTSPAVVGTDPAEETTEPTGEPSAETPAADPPTEEPATDGDGEPNGADDQTAEELAVGEFATINDTGVNLRPNAALAGEPVATLDAGTRVEIIGGPEDADEYTWWEIVVDGTGDTGFVAEDFLEPAS